MSQGRPLFGRLLFLVAPLLLAAAPVRAGDPFPQASDAERALIASARSAVQASCECSPARKHGAYMRCVSHAVKAQVSAGQLSKKQMHMVMMCADRSTCGRPNAVTCCKTNKRGRTKCTVVSASKCAAPRGGTACVTGLTSWCDATEQGCSAAQLEHDTQCCLPPANSPGGALIDCELLKPSGDPFGCIELGGVPVGDGTCDPNPCPPVATTTTTVATTTSTTGSEPTTTSTTETTTTTSGESTTTTTTNPCGNGVLDAGEQCDPPWSRNPEQCPPLPGHRFGPECGDDCRCVTTSTTTPSTTTTTATGAPTTTTTLPPTCGNGNLDAGEACDPPGSITCPDPTSPAGALLECQPGCVCPGGPTTTTTSTVTTAPTTTTTSSTVTTAPTTTTTSSTVTTGPTTTTTSTTVTTAPTTTTTSSTVTTAPTTTTTSTTVTTAPTTTTTTSTTVTTTTATTATTTSTTSTTTTSTTTTTSGPPTLSFTTAIGTANCGPAGLSSNGPAPYSGELTTDTACTQNVRDLGLGCLFFGGGSATVVPPGKIPDQAASIFSVTGGTTLVASSGTSLNNCTKGAGPARHCINNNAQAVCANDAGCGGAAGSCALDANCFFGPPLPILSPPPFGSLTTCVLNAIQSDGSGTVNTATGESTASLPLSSRVYITGNTGSPCPKCTGTCTYGKNAGGVCTPVGSLQTTNDCHPGYQGFQAPLAVTLSPLTTGTVTKTAADGLFCPGQVNPGAFGQASARCISETGSPTGALTPNTPTPGVLASVFCIPPTNNVAVDGVADLPGPGAIGLNGTVLVNF